MVDVLLYKLGLKNHLVDNWSATFSWPKTVHDKIRDSTISHSAYRAVVGQPGDKAQMHMQWRVGWPDSAIEFWTFLEMLVFTNTHDDILRSHCKNRRTFEEVVATSGLKEFFDDITTMAEQDDHASHA